MELADQVEAVAADSSFAGVVRIDRSGEIAYERAFGLARRDLGTPNTTDTQFAIASGLKGMTALAVLALVEDGVLELETTARSLLRDDLPLVADDVTVEQLLSHRSGIGDYLDESTLGEITDHVLAVPVHTLVGPEDFVPILDGRPTKFAAGTRFSYCNGGYVLLALIAERASGIPYHDLVLERVCAPAGMRHSEFLRSDALPATAALGYLAADGLQTNVLHLPVRGTGDGGIYTTVADMRAFWTALFEGRIVSEATVELATRSRSDASDGRGYGLGFWLVTGSAAVALEGYDAGVSFRSLHDPETDTTCTVISNWSDGAWPLGKALEERFFR